MADWDPEIDVDPALARRLIVGQFPALRGADVAPLAAGWDNTVYAVDGRWAFRFPRRASAIPGVEREIAALPRLAGHLSLPIPQPQFIGQPTDDGPWPWFGTPLLRGVELVDARLSDPDRREVARSLGRFLRELHAPALARLVGAMLSVDLNRRADMAFRIPLVRERLMELEAAGTWTTTREVRALLDDAVGLPAPSRTAVMHGDLHVRHVLVDGRAVSGVIDWGDVCMGDPSVDLSIAYSAFGPESRLAFLDAYGPIDGLTELRARVVATFLSATLLAYAAGEGMAPLRHESLLALDRVAR